jgi:hypothetical protein
MKLLGGNDVEAVVQRLDRLTVDEASVTATRTLEVVYDLIQNMRVVMDSERHIGLVIHRLLSMPLQTARPPHR